MNVGDRIIPRSQPTQTWEVVATFTLDGQPCALVCVLVDGDLYLMRPSSDGALESALAPDADGAYLPDFSTQTWEVVATGADGAYPPDFDVQPPLPPSECPDCGHPRHHPLPCHEVGAGRPAGHGHAGWVFDDPCRCGV